MTPARPGELTVGKLAPYLALAFVEFLTVAAFMRTVFDVPVAGSFLLLSAINGPFVVAALGTGLLISARPNTRDEASQKGMGGVPPSVFPSGYVFPLESMPAASRPPVASPPDDLDDRHRPRRHSPRGRLVRPVGARPRAGRDGGRRRDAGRPPVPEAGVLTAAGFFAFS